ncbi:MAG: hypothetical protein IJT50_10440 [Lentisphaeria bacterium]|nr:hypothetical protein [Lentisphaeria bacterium]
MKKLLFTLAAAAFAAQAATYYVSPLGNNNNAGTDPAKPLKTIQKALVKAGSGDTVLLKGGLYHEMIFREWPNKNPQPITIKASPDETPVVTFGWRLRGWRKEQGRLFSAPCAWAIRELWQRNTLDRYLKVDSMKLLEKQPGAFFQRPEDGRLFVNPLSGSWHDDPEKAGFTVIPYATNSRPTPIKAKNPGVFGSGMNFVVHNICVDGLHFAFHGGAGIAIRGRQKDWFYGSGVIRNCTAVGTTCGFRPSWVLDGVLIEKCRAIRNSGAGIQIGSYQKNIKIRDNFLLDNGCSLPFFGSYTVTEGNVYNMCRYGSPEADYIDFTGNLIISLDKSRRAGVMRCKNGIRRHTNVLNNVLAGGGATFYAVPGSTASIDNNTVVPGKFSFTTSSSGKKYMPDLKDNIYGGQDWRKKGGFVNPEKYDFRLLPDSPYKGTGAFPGPAPVYFAAPDKTGAGDGRLPRTPVAAGKLPSLLKNGDTVYFLPGEYTGEYLFRGLKDITLSDRSCGKAVWRNAKFEFDNCENVKIADMDFDNVRFEAKNSTVTFTDAVFGESSFKGEKGKAVFANSRLFKFKGVSSGRMVFRENLLDNCKVEAPDVISEHNGFADDAQLKAWPFKETFPSFTAGVRRGGRVEFPAKNLVEGTAGTWIGGRAVRDEKGPLKVENIAVSSLDCGTRALITWTTPEDYVRAEVSARQNDRGVFYGQVPFGRYLTCDGAVCLRNLKPGVPCRAVLRLYRHNDVKPWTKVLEFTPVKSAGKSAGKVLEAGNGKPYKTVAAALQAARPGDTVLIAPGTYGEMLTVWRDDITIRAAKPGTVKLSAEFMFDHIIRADDVKGLTIENLDFIGLRYSGAVAGVTLFRSEKFKMKNCRFLAIGARKTGNNHFYGEHLKDVEISNCVFERAFQCVWITSCKGYVKMDHNTFSRSGINAMHLGGSPGAELFITNNLIFDVVGKHNTPAVTVGDPRSKVVCDWNLYWNTQEFCPRQKIFALGGKLGTAAAWQIYDSDMAKTLAEAQTRYGVEKHGIFADPKLKDPAGGDLTLLPDSPARKRGSDGRDIGADMSVFASR